MKKKILFAWMILFSMHAMSQENLVTLSGGYSFANIRDSDEKGTGWRINALYEFNMAGGMFSHGLSVGYISLSSSEGLGQQTIESKLSSFPIYYAPKVIFGKDKVRAFVKGALGMQFASLEREGAITLSDSDYGWYTGGGAGIMVFIKENIFINAEYEIAWASSGYYKDGWINTAMAGIGFKF